MGKKYLLLANLPEEQVRTEEIAFAFMEKAYLTDSVLFFMIDGTKEAYNYYRWLMRNVFFGSVKIQLLINGQHNPEQLIQQVDYYIVGNHPAEFAYLNFAIKHNVEIIGTIEKPADIFKDIPISKDITQFKNNLKDSVKRELLKKYPFYEYEYFLFHEGLGESIAFFFWMKKYREIHDRKILAVCVNPLREELLKACPYIDVTIKITPQAFDYLAIYLAKEYNMRKVLTAHVIPEVLEERYRQKIDVMYDFEQQDTIRRFLGIDSSVKFETYPVNIPKDSVANANRLFKAMQLTNNKVVFIFNEGIAFGNLMNHNDFWVKLARALNANGYEVVTNGDKETIPNCRNIYLKLFESVAFAGICGNVISVPTGFAEAVCIFNQSAPLTFQVIFPNKHDERYKNISTTGIENLRYYGSKFADKIVSDYANYMNWYLSSNVDFSCHQLGDNPDEDNELINKIVAKIIRGD